MKRRIILAAMACALISGVALGRKPLSILYVIWKVESASTAEEERRVLAMSTNVGFLWEINVSERTPRGVLSIPYTEAARGKGGPGLQLELEWLESPPWSHQPFRAHRTLIEPKNLMVFETYEGHAANDPSKSDLNVLQARAALVEYLTHNPDKDLYSRPSSSLLAVKPQQVSPHTFVVGPFSINTQKRTWSATTASGSNRFMWSGVFRKIPRGDWVADLKSFGAERTISEAETDLERKLQAQPRTP